MLRPGTQLANEPVYDHTTYDKIPLPPAKDDAYLEGAPLTTKSKSGRKLRVVCAGSGATGITVVREYYRNPDVMESCEVALYEALATHGGTWCVGSNGPLARLFSHLAAPFSLILR